MTYEKNLMPWLAREMGDTDTSNLYFLSDQLFSAINDGIKEFNLETPDQRYDIVNSGENAYINPDPENGGQSKNYDDRKLIVLYSALALTRGEVQKAARTAFVHSNPAGRTDLSRIPRALESQAERLERRIRKAWVERKKGMIQKGLEDHGSKRLRSRDITEPTYAEGTPITTIEHGV